MCLAALTLSGCAVMSFVGETEADMLPTWLGGLPANTPPRPGEAGYRKVVMQAEGTAPEQKAIKTSKDSAESAR